MIWKKIMLSFTFVLLILVIIIGVNFFAIQTIYKNTEVVANDIIPLSTAVRAPDKSIVNLQNAVMEYVMNQNPKSLDSYDQDFEQLNKDLTVLHSYNQKYPALKKLMGKLDQHINNMKEFYDSQISLVDNFNVVEAQMNDEKNKQYMEEYRAIQDKLTKEMEKINHQSLVNANELKNKIIMFSILVSIIAIIFISLIALKVVQNISSPIRKVSNVLEQISNGDLTFEEIKTTRKDEIGDMLRSLNKMIRDLNNMVTQVSESALQVAAKSEQLSASSAQGSISAKLNAQVTQETVEVFDQQLNAFHDISLSIQAISTGIEEIGGTSSDMMSVTEEATLQTSNGSNAVNNMSNQMRDINESVEQTTAIIQSLGEQSKEIDNIVIIGAIASRVAIAIDNAMLFETERQTALAFQKSLLPQAIPDLDGLEVACRYVPAKPLETQGQGIQTQVGGDWYDIIPLAAGRVGIVIGDVEGRGARAAAIMGQLRAALRAFAQDEKSPADIMRKLDEWCRALAPADENGMTAGDPPTVSCIYMIYDAWSRELTFANAGHDAPLLISAGQVRQLEFMYKGVLLGVRGKGIRGCPRTRSRRSACRPGPSWCSYTDGLTDRRTRADGSGHYSEAEAVRDAAARGPRRRGQRGRRRGGHGGRVRGARRHRRRHGHLGGEVLAVRTRLDRALVPGRADHGLRGQAGCRADVPVLGHGPRAGRTRVPAGLRGGHQRRPARLGHAEPGPRPGFRHGAADDARAGRRVG